MIKESLHTEKFNSSENSNFHKGEMDSDDKKNGSLFFSPSVDIQDGDLNGDYRK